MGVYSNSLQNAHVALGRRVLMRYCKNSDTYNERIVPSDELVKQRLGRFRQRFLRQAFAPVVCGIRNYPGLYTGGKRKVYQRAVDSLARDPLNKKDARVTGFVKVESTKLGADPRLIQTRSPRFHASLGRFLKCSEKGILHGVDEYFGERTVTKGLNAAEIGELIERKFSSFPDPVAIGIDASRFDRSVSTPVLRFVHSIYRQHFGADGELHSLLRQTINSEGRIYCPDGRIIYHVDGGVMSGDIDTSLKGCIIMCALVGSWLETVGVKAKLVNNGDDCVVFMNRPDVDKLCSGMKQYFAELGFDIVAEKPVYEVEKVEFCQSRPVMSSIGTYVMCRNPYVASVKDSICRLQCESVVKMQAWSGAVSDCGLALAGDMPIFSSYYRTMSRYAGEKREKWMLQDGRFMNGLLWLSKGMTDRFGVTDSTRVSFWRAWGIAPHEQRAIEQYYDGVEIGLQFDGPVENYPQSSFHAPESCGYVANDKATQS